MPGSLEEGLRTGQAQFFPTLEGIGTLLSDAVAAASAWAHLLAINLFAARHVVSEATAAAAANDALPALATRLAVFAAAVAGPLGILVHEVAVRLRARGKRKAAAPA